jgi:hypothetical protein
MPDMDDGRGDGVGPLEAPEEEDHDLLTLTLATDRLSVAVREEQERLAAAQSAGDDAAAQKSRERIAQLEEAAVRHARVPITAVNAAQFYGFDAEGAGPRG